MEGKILILLPIISVVLGILLALNNFTLNINIYLIIAILLILSLILSIMKGTRFHYPGAKNRIAVQFLISLIAIIIFCAIGVALTYIFQIIWPAIP